MFRFLLNLTLGFLFCLAPAFASAKAKGKVERNISSIVSSACDNAREYCGKSCNMQFEDDDTKWDQCFGTCVRAENPTCMGEPAKVKKDCGERARETCGSRFNTEAGSSDRKWNKCFNKCITDC